MFSDSYHWHYDYARLAKDSGFTFVAQRFKTSVDKFNIGHLDVNQVIQERDVITVEKHIRNVIEFGLDNEQLVVLDKGFVKIFRLSQLSLEYLLFCMKYLDNTVVVLKNELQKVNEENKYLRTNSEQLKGNVVALKRTVKELKFSLECKSKEGIGIFQCDQCSKAFSTEEYLLAHHKRRHEINPAHTSLQSETDKLHLEIKELKERLNNTEKYIHADNSENPNISSVNANSNNHSTLLPSNGALIELQQKFELLKIQVENELKTLQTQKFDQQKYEEWFTSFLRKLEDVNVKGRYSERDTKLTSGASGDCLEKKNNSTQTVTVLYEGLCSKCKQDASQTVSDNKIIQVPSKYDGVSDVHVLQQMRMENENNLEKFGQVIQEQVSGNMMRLETQLMTFWAKLQQVEEQTKTNINSKSVVPYHEVSSSKLLHSNQKSLIKNKTVQKKPRTPVKKKKAREIKSTQSSPIKTVKLVTTVKDKFLVTSNNYNNPQNKKVATKMSVTEKVTDTSSSSDDDLNESRSEMLTHFMPDNKPSHASTLAQRSITSLKEATFDGDVLNGLREELKLVLQNCLKNLGVSPSWTSLPDASYQNTLSIVAHEAVLAQKNYVNYGEIKKGILESLEQQINHAKLIKPVRKRSKLPKPRKKVIETRQSTIDVQKNKPASINTQSDLPKSPLINKPLFLESSDDDDSFMQPDRGPKVEMPNDLETAKVATVKEDTADIKNERNAKSVLKSYPSTGSLQKKKVLFDLDSDTSDKASLNVQKRKKEESGSTTSIASSVFDAPKDNIEHVVETVVTTGNKVDTKYDSDWELSDFID